MMYLIAFVISYLLFMAQVKQRKLELDPDLVLNFFFWAIIGLLIGARLFATLLFDKTGEYLRKPWLIFWPFRKDLGFIGLQGMNYYGGVVGAVIAAVIYSRAKKINLLDWGDMLLTGVPLGYTFGRFGNFINAELYGRLTKAPWGVLFPTARPIPTGEAWVHDWAADVGIAIGQQTSVNLPRHPTQIYEAILEGIILWLVLWFIVRKRKPYDGFIIGLYIILYGVIRFALDYFRMPISANDFALRLVGDKPVYFVQSPLNLIPSQFYSLAMIIGGAIFLIVVKRYQDRKAAAAPDVEGEGKPSMRKLRKKIK